MDETTPDSGLAATGIGWGCVGQFILLILFLAALCRLSFTGVL